jgi:hypothetical protein
MIMNTIQQVTTDQDRTLLSVDGLSRFIGAGTWAAIASGGALVAYALWDWLVVPYEQLGQAKADLTGSYLLSQGLLLLSTILLLWGLIGIYGRQSRATGTFGLWALVVAFLTTAFLAGNNWATLFVWPTLAQVAPNVMSGQGWENLVYLKAGISLSGPLFGIGIILFAVATIRAGVYPRWAAVVLIVSIPVNIFLDPTPGQFQEYLGPILQGIAVAALGFYALRRAPSSTSS